MKYFIGSITILLVVPLILYWYYFGSTELSKNFKDWTEFSQFYILFATVSTSIALAILTYSIHKENIGFNKPILIFKIEGSEYFPHSIKNIGNGPAINIEIYYSNIDIEWDVKIKGLTLAKDEVVILRIPQQKRLGAIFYDQSENLYKSYMKDTSMNFKNIDNEFSQKVITEKYIWEFN